MAICIGLGWWAWKEDMNITFVCYWGLMGLINGLFGLVQLIDHQVHSPMPMFSSRAPAMYNAHSAIRLLQELSLLAGAAMAYMIYSRHDQPAEGGSGWGGAERAPLAQGQAQWSQPKFKTF